MRIMEVGTRHTHTHTYTHTQVRVFSCTLGGWEAAGMHAREVGGGERGGSGLVWLLGYHRNLDLYTFKTSTFLCLEY